MMTFAWLATWAASVTAGVTARLEPAIVDELETTRLILQVTGASAETPDLAPLSGDFEVLGTQSTSKYQAVNGVIGTSVEYQITLRPTRTGELTIPPIAIGSAASPPLSLVVRAVDPALRAAIDRMVFFELELTRNPVYLRGETVLVRRLYYSSATQIYSDLPGAPELPDALVLPIGDTHSTTAIRNGERYGVIEQRFAIYPQRTGSLTIPSISLTSSVRLQVDGRNHRTGARVSTPSLSVEVLPIPPEYPADVPWLPAVAVKLRDDWSPDRAHLAVGEPLQRQITVAVSGNLAAAIAPPDDRVPEGHFRQYPEPPVLADDRSGRSVTGTRGTNYAIVPTTPGNVEVPGLAITWWDVNAGAVRTTQTPARTLSIGGSTAAAADATAQAGAAAAPDAGSTTVIPAEETDHPPPHWSWWWAGLGAVAAALLVFAWRYAPHARSAATRGLRQVLECTGLTGAERGLGRRRRLRRARRAVAERCRASDPAAVEHALHDYLACWYRTTPAHALEHFRAAGHAPLLDRLQAARFGPAHTQPPAAAEVLGALDRLRPMPKAPADPLPELFEHP